jgi:hypothetical protein
MRSFPNMERWLTPMVDRETGRSKVFAFVTFDNVAQLAGKLVLILDDKQVRRHVMAHPNIASGSPAVAQIEVRTAQPRSQRDQQRLGHTATTPTSNFNNGQVAASNGGPRQWAAACPSCP